GNGVYLNNLDQLLLSTARLVSGAIGERPSRAAYLTDPAVLAPAGLVLLGLLVAAWRRAWWMVGAVALAVILPPAFSGKYRPIMDGRYLMPLVPVLFVAIGLAIGSVGRAVTASALAPTVADGPGRLGLRAAGVAALALLAIGTGVLVERPVTLLETFYEQSIEDGFSNTSY